MAPKKRKEKGDAGASSSAAILDASRFCHEAAERHYVMLMDKSMPRERGYDLEHRNRPLIIQAISQHWGDFIKPPTEAVIPVVREFYANLRVDNEFSQVRVRGKRIPFNAIFINRLYNLPDIENDEYTAFKQTPVEYDEILDYLCYPGAVWKLNANRQVMNFKAKYLKQAATAVFLFVIARLMPAKHATDVTKERAILIYCILKGYTINVGKIIEASILHASRKKRNISLPHSSLITELCQSGGVQWTEEEEVLRLQVPIKVPTRRTMDEDDGPTARASGSTSQHPERPPRQPTMNQRLDSLEHKVDNLYSNTATFMEYLVGFNTALAQRFPDPNQQYTPFPPPPEWQDEEEEDDDEEEEDDDEQ